MGTIEIICTALGTAITVIGGVYGVVNYIFNKGMAKEHSANFEKTAIIEFAKIGRHFDKMNLRMDKQEAETRTAISNLETKVEKRLDKFSEDLSEVKNNVELHTNALVEIYTVLGRDYPQKEGSFALKNSPRKLTDLGQKIFNEVNGEEFLRDNKEILYKYIEEHKPLTRLDVEQLAHRALFMQTNTPIFNHIKDYVYEAPAYKDADGEMSELTIGDICFILSIPLRDMYLKERNFK